MRQACSTEFPCTRTVIRSITVLSAPEREKKYPPSTLRWISTSNAPSHVRHEFLDYVSGRPGLCNPYEIRLCIREFENLLKKYPLHEISLISPYNLQIRKLRNELSRKFRHRFSEDEWNRFLFTRVSTVDSFQGGESDAVIISYVRSNSGAGIGFTDNPNRINVAYTRCRDELVIIGDLDCLKNQDKNGIFPADGTGISAGRRNYGCEIFRTIPTLLPSSVSKTAMSNRSKKRRTESAMRSKFHGNHRSMSARDI